MISRCINALFPHLKRYLRLTKWPFPSYHRNAYLCGNFRMFTRRLILHCNHITHQVGQAVILQILTIVYLAHCIFGLNRQCPWYLLNVSSLNMQMNFFRYAICKGYDFCPRTFLLNITYWFAKVKCLWLCNYLTSWDDYVFTSGFPFQNIGLNLLPWNSYQIYVLKWGPW